MARMQIIALPSLLGMSMTPRWQEIDQSLPADHLARQIDLSGCGVGFGGVVCDIYRPREQGPLARLVIEVGALRDATWSAESSGMVSGCEGERACAVVVVWHEALSNGLVRVFGSPGKHFGTTGTSRHCTRRKNMGSARGRSRGSGRHADCRVGLAPSVGESENVDGSVGGCCSRRSAADAERPSSREPAGLDGQASRHARKSTSAVSSRPKRGWINCRRKTQNARVPSGKSRRKSW